jgi:hypothetical protein
VGLSGNENHPCYIIGNMSLRKPLKRLTIEEHRNRLVELGYKLPGADTQMGIALECFLIKPNRDVEHKDAKYWIEQECVKRTGKKCEDPDKQIRSLHQRGILKKIGNGIYRYDPDDLDRELGGEFPAAVRKQILERDHHKCVMCGLGKEDGVIVHVDHKVPRNRGGRGTLANGQTLCSVHNYRKKNLSQAEMGQRFFEQLRDDARKGDLSSPEARAHMQLIDEVLLAYRRFEDLLGEFRDQ